MTRRKKPHPRSLDALFPKPKPVRVKRCPRGHTQTPHWHPWHGCSACQLYDEASERIANRDLNREREEWSRRLNVGPVITTYVVSTGRTIYHAIPRHLRKANRPRGRGRVKRRA